VLILLLSSAAHAGEELSLLDRYTALALQGNLAEAASLFRETDQAGETVFDAALANRFQKRFVERNEAVAPGSGDPAVDAIVTAYRDYWALVLTGAQTADQGKLALEAELSKALSDSGEHETAAAGGDVFIRVGRLLDDREYYYLDTPAPPLLDLFLWKKQKNRTYRVRLTDRTEEVRVTFLDQVYSLGWKEYATLGLVATTGWVEGERLYCVEDAYERSSEKFEVSFLKHERRHLADLKRFPSLDSAELEYRAKLTELAFASTSLATVLDDFTGKSADNPDSPHAWANYRVTRDLYREMFGGPFPESGNPWAGADPAAVNSTARVLLKQNTERIEAGGS
jgi:hypothetical protein